MLSRIRTKRTKGAFGGNLPGTRVNSDVKRMSSKRKLGDSNDGSRQHDFVYFAYLELAPKEKATIGYTSPWFNRGANSVKIGFTNAGSYPNSIDGMQPFRRLSGIDTGNPLQRQMKTSAVPRGRGHIVEQLTHSYFEDLGQKFTEAPWSGEMFCISIQQIELIDGTFITDYGAFGATYEEMESIRHPESDEARAFYRATIQAFSATPEHQRMVQLANEHMATINAYQPLQPSTDTPQQAVDNLFTGRFQEIVGEEIVGDINDENVFTLDYGKLRDRRWRSRAQRKGNYGYMARIVVPGGVQLTPQTALFIALHKLGMINGGSPYNRFHDFQKYSQFPIEIIFFRLPTSDHAIAAEKLFHNAFELCRSKNEWFFLTTKMARAWLLSFLNFVRNEGHSPLRNLSTANVQTSNHIMPIDLGTPEELVGEFDAIARRIMPVDDIQVRPLEAIRITRMTNQVVFSEVQFVALLRRSIELSMRFPSMNGGNLLRMLATDTHIGLTWNSGIVNQIELWFVRILGVNIKEFKRSTSPGQLICNVLAENGPNGETYPHLEYENLHRNWFLLLSNRHQIRTRSVQAR